MTERQLPPVSFEGAQLSQMRKWAQGGGGSTALYDTASLWQNEDAFMRGLKSEIEAKLKEAGAVMQSTSGDAMQNQALPVVLWTEVAAGQAKMQGDQMTAQGEAFKRVQDSMPAESEEQAVPDDTWLEEGWDTMWTGSTDAEDAKAHNEKLRQEAVQAFTAYQETTQGHVSSSAVFEKPPQIAVHNPEASGSAHPTVGGVNSPSPSSTSSAWAGGSGAGSGGAGAVGGSGGAGGGYAGSGAGSPAGTGSAWANSPGGPNAGNGGSGNAGRTGAPGTPGYGGTAGRPGMPGAGRPGAGAGSGGARGAGSGAGRGVGAGGGAGRAGGPGMGAGGRAGAGGLGGASGSTAAGGAAGGAGGRGGAGMGGAGARGSGQQGEEDAEHETPDYLVGDQGVFDEDLPRVAPPVFGE